MDRSDAKATALAGMRAFARPEMGEERWWDELTPLLTDQARHDYAYTDPANVPANRVTGARVLPTDADVLARVLVATNVGEYTVMLTRSPENPQWRIDRMLPPPTSGPHDHAHGDGGRDER